MQTAPLSDHNFKRTRELLLSLAGIKLRDGKQLMVLNRLAKPMRLHGYTKLEDYLGAVEKKSDLSQEFINALTTNVTSFFRERHHFEMLKTFLDRKGKNVRIWSAGCSTGQEPYSIALALLECFPDLVNGHQPAKVLATDIDTQAIATATKGCYAASSLNMLSSAVLDKHFTRTEEQQWQVKPHLRQLVEFHQSNLSELGAKPIWVNLDAIFCRNVLIYFDKDMQRKIVLKLIKSLAPQGMLFSGHSEMLLHSSEELVSLGKTSYQLRRGSL